MGTPEMFLFSTTIIHGDLSIVRQDRCRVCETLTISPSLNFSRACSTSSIPTDVYSSREMGHTWHTFSQLNPLKIHWPIGAALLRGTTRKEGVTFAASQKEVLASVGQLCQRDLKSCCFQRGLSPRIWGSFNHFGIDIPFECAYVFVLLLVGFNGYMCDCSSIFITRAFRTCWKQGWHYIVDNLKKIWSHGISWGSRAPNWNQLNHLNMMFLFLELSFPEFHVLPETNIPAAHLIPCGTWPDSKVMDVDRWQPPTIEMITRWNGWWKYMKSQWKSLLPSARGKSPAISTLHNFTNMY